MFIVITGLDGSGTSTIATKLHNLDKGSILLHTPSTEYDSRGMIDTSVYKTSTMAHYLYYLSSVAYISDYIKKNIDISKINVYCVRYLIDTIVSHRVAGLDVTLDYSTYNLLEPDMTIFINLDENKRKERIENRGKSVLDKILDDSIIRDKFLKEFDSQLRNSYVLDNGKDDIDNQVEDLYKKYILNKDIR